MTAPTNNLTPERVRDLLHYDPETGVFTWRVNRTGSARAGRIAGCLNSRGYLKIRIDGRLYPAHRLAWLHAHGRWPVDQVDHRNGKRSDNRIANLRECSGSENAHNLVRKLGWSGLRGATASREKWQGRIAVNGKQRHLGMFDTPEAAHAAYVRAKAIHHPFQPTIPQREVSA